MDLSFLQKKAKELCSKPQDQIQILQLPLGRDDPHLQGHELHQVMKKGEVYSVDDFQILDRAASLTALQSCHGSIFQCLLQRLMT